MKYKSVLMVGLLLLSVFAAFGVPNASAANKNYLRVDDNFGSMSNRYVNSGNAFTLGDKDIFFSISAENIQWDVGHWDEYVIQNISAKVVARGILTAARSTSWTSPTVRTLESTAHSLKSGATRSRYSGSRPMWSPQAPQAPTT